MADGVKMQDVAERAGVSISTVSLILGGDESISEETRRRVLEAVRELDYVPQRKRKRRKSRSNGPDAARNVALLYSVESRWRYLWPFLQEFVESFNEGLLAGGRYAVLIPYGEAQPMEEVLERIQTARCGAVVPLLYSNRPLYEALEATGLPVLIALDNLFFNEFLSVCVDDYQGGYDGVEYLKSRGHEFIAYVGLSRPDTLPLTANDRFIGYKKAMDAGTVGTREEYICRLEELEQDEEVTERLSRLFDGRLRRPSALFCLHDRVALFVYYALRRLKLSVPEDVSLLAPGDLLDYSLPSTPRISTVRTPTRYLGTLAADLLLRRLDPQRDESVFSMKIQQQIVERGSVLHISAT